MNVSLTPKLDEFIRRKVASGLYNNASEVIRAGLRLLIEREGGAGVESALKIAPQKNEVLNRLATLEKHLRARGVTSLALFGSLARGTARPGSDIDVLIDTDPDAHFSLVDLVAVKNLLEEQLAHGVDVVTRQGIEPAIREQVLREAEFVF